LFEKRVWHISRIRPDRAAVSRAAALIKSAKRPMIVAGGGVIYSDASAVLAQFVDATGIPVGETMAGKGSLRYDNPLNLGAVGVTGTFAANRFARDADVVIGIGTRYSDFTTASKTAFQHPDVRFVNINVCELDAAKHNGAMLLGDAREVLSELLVALQGHQVDASYRAEAQRLQADWDAEVQRIYDIRLAPLPSQGEIIGVVNDHSDPEAVMVCAAGSLPGDLHKLWRARHPKNYHLEYGNSCMGYEVAGGLGIKMAAPEREVYVMVGDGSWLMMSSELVTAIQEDRKLIVVLIDNDGYKSIGGLSRSLGQEGFGTRYAYPQQNMLPSDADGNDVVRLPVDLASNARSLGADVIECRTHAEFVAGIAQARQNRNTTVVYIRNDRYHGVPGYESWWDVPPAEVSTSPEVQAKRVEWAAMRAKEQDYL
ncbi:MAG: thiamine pyrophosphate-dependent enzyme, partial [Chloroflexota bacterium]